MTVKFTLYYSKNTPAAKPKLCFKGEIDAGIKFCLSAILFTQYSRNNNSITVIRGEFFAAKILLGNDSLAAWTRIAERGNRPSWHNHHSSSYQFFAAPIQSSFSLSNKTRLGTGLPTSSSSLKVTFTDKSRRIIALPSLYSGK